MQHQRVQTEHLWGEAFLATLSVVVAPVAVVLAAITWGLPDPQVLVSTALGLALSCGAATVGTRMWLRRPESVDISFGELMLWRYLRRRKADRSIEAHSAELRAVPPISPLTVVPGRRVDLLHRLTGALEAKDPYTHGHSRRVSRYAYRTAMALNLASDEIEDLRLAAALHDVGKIDLPDAVLRKPGDLSEEEFALVRRHPEIGADMVAFAASPAVSDGIRYHHEAWNGQGYPHGLRGEEIPQAARIICVADAFDAMTSARPYRPGMSRREAVEALRAGAGVQFDPVVVEAFVDELPAALQAAGAFLIFALPAQGLRRIAAWSKAAGGGSVASAVGVTAMAVMVGGATFHPAPVTPPPGTPVEVVAATEADEPIEVTLAKQRSPRTEVLGKQIKRKKKEEPRRAGRRERVKKAGARDSGGSAPGGAGSGGGPQKEPKPKPKPKPKPGPRAPTDPQPDRGRDCSASKKDSKGHRQHCGD